MATPFRPPKDNLYRSAAEVEFRADDSAENPVLTGHFAVFNRWTEINSTWEGRFLERIAPGAFKKSFRETTPKVLLNHGFDAELTDRPLGRVDTLKEDDRGGYYEVPLYRGIPELVMDGLKDGAYGASFRFRVIRESIVDDPEPSEDNPKGLPERTIDEAHVMEFGPVTFPAYEEASAGIRSLTDDMFVASLRSKPDATELDGLFAEWVERNPQRAAEIFSDSSLALIEWEDRSETEEPSDDTPDDEPPSHSAAVQEPRPRTPASGAATEVSNARGDDWWRLDEENEEWNLP